MGSRRALRQASGAKWLNRTMSARAAGVLEKAKFQDKEKINLDLIGWTTSSRETSFDLVFTILLLYYNKMNSIKKICLDDLYTLKNCLIYRNRFWLLICGQCPWPNASYLESGFSTKVCSPSCPYATFLKRSDQNCVNSCDFNNLI